VSPDNGAATARRILRLDTANRIWLNASTNAS